MRWCRGTLVPVAVICAAPALGGCTVYTEPARVSAGATVRSMGTVESDSFSLFYDALTPAGQWLEAPVCGRRFGRVWRPDPREVGGDFTPYRTGGEWVATDQGWAFESDFDWGWATFHYGRWCDDPRYGWVWVPGDEWAPAWVDWRYGGGYVGWAPLPPTGVALRDNHWIFVERPNFAGGRVTHYALPRERVIEARRVARPVGRYVRHHDYGWSAGPSPEEVGVPSRPVHVAPPARGKVQRVIIRRH